MINTKPMRTFINNVHAKCTLTIFLFMLCIPLTIVAQEKMVKGHIVDEAGLPLIGATVMEIGTGKGTVTDNNGQYSLTLTSKAPVLKFSYMGYSDLEVAVDNRTVINVTLEETVYALDEIVSIGYTSLRRRDLTAAVSSVSGADLENLPLSSVEQALTGKLAGVQVTTAEGDFDSDLKVRVRGGTSITQDNSPIYIIDGVESEEGLAGLSIQNIASIDVLKDAASTSIYGARGANGIVVVTTKEAKQGSPKISYNPSLGANKVVRKYDVMDTYEYILHQDERSRLSQPLRDRFVRFYGSDVSVYENESSIDWQDLLFGRTALQHRHNIAISGGNPNFTYHISYDRDDLEGVMEKSHYNRDVLRLNLGQNVNKKLSLRQIISYSKAKTMGAGVSSTSASTYNMLRNIIMYTPILAGEEFIDQYDPDFFFNPEVPTSPLLIPSH